jgi:hypothetical protein
MLTSEERERIRRAYFLEFVGESYRFRQRMLMEGQATATETG